MFALRSRRVKHIKVLFCTMVETIGEKKTSLNILIGRALKIDLKLNLICFSHNAKTTKLVPIIFFQLRCFFREKAFLVLGTRYQMGPSYHLKSYMNHEKTP